jgi:hypothetical protein
VDPVGVEMFCDNGKGWEELDVLIGQAISKTQFCIVKLTNGPNKLHFVANFNLHRHPPNPAYLFQN